jgi:hypothetical protein
MSTVGDRSLERFEDMVDFVDRSGVDGVAMHLKIKAYHPDVTRGDKLKQSYLVELLMQRQWNLKHLYPDSTTVFREVKEEVARRAHQYYDLVVAQTTEGQYSLEDALDLYDSFYYIHQQQLWGDFPASCWCLGCCKWTIC